MVDYTISPNNIHIVDSYKVAKRNFAPELEHIKALHYDNEVFRNRSIKSLSREWATHNALYSLGILRDRTGSVDLNYPLKWWVELLYNIVGVLVWPFIK